MIGAHSTIDRPEPVRRVTPPRIIMPKMVAQQASSQIAMALWSLLIAAVDVFNKSVSRDASRLCITRPEV